MLATQQFISSKPQRIQVARRANIAELIGHHLRGHVLGRAFDHTAFMLRKPTRDPEVTQLDAMVLVQQQVGGLHVAVDDPIFLKKLQSLTHIDDGQTQVFDIDGLPMEFLRQAALHQFENEPAAIFDDIKNRHDVGMLEPRQQLSFAPVTLQLFGVRQILIVNLLDRDLPIEFSIHTSIDRRKITLRDFFHDLVTRVLGRHPGVSLLVLNNRERTSDSTRRPVIVRGLEKLN